MPTRVRAVPAADVTVREPEEIYDAFCDGEAAAVAQVRGRVEGVVGLGNWRFRDPEGVVQEILLKLVRLSRGSGFERHSTFKTFVFSVAKFTCVDLYRRQGRRPEDELPEDLPLASGERTLEQWLEYRDLVRYLLQRLPDECTRLWRLLYGESLTASEIGHRVGATAGTIRVRVHRCLKQARRLGGELEAEGWELR